MRKGIKGLFAVLLLLFALGLTGCALFDSPQRAVRSSLNAYKNNLDDLVEDMSYQDFWGGYSDSKKLDKDGQAVVKELFRDFDYEIISSEQDKDKATVKVKITTLDMEKLSLDYKRALLKYFIENGEKSGEETLSFSIFKKVLDKGKYGKRTIEGTLNVKKNGKWELVEDDSFRNTVLGNFFEYYEDFKQISAKEVAKSYLDYTLSKEFLRELMEDDKKKDPITYAIIDQITDRISYKLGKEKIDGKKAEVEVTVTEVDFSGIEKQLEKKIQASVMEFTGFSDKEIEKKVSDMIVELLKNNKKTRERRLALKFSGDDGVIWGPENMAEVFETLFDAVASFRGEVSKK